MAWLLATISPMMDNPQGTDRPGIEPVLHEFVGVAQAASFMMPSSPNTMALSVLPPGQVIFAQELNVTHEAIGAGG